MIPLNTQAPEKRIDHGRGALDIVDIFPTIQGEGPYVGRPSIFMRLAGCDLQCPGCDTDYSSNRKVYSLEEYVDRIQVLTRTMNKHKTRPLVVITGGEPMRQPLGPACKSLLMLGYSVQIETNGTIFDESLEGVFPRIYVVCSPKTPTVAKELWPVINSLKYVIQEGKVDPTDGLPTDVLISGLRPARPTPQFRGTIYVQPCDEGVPELNALNTQATIKSCMEHGHTLCLQVHKLVGLP